MSVQTAAGGDSSAARSWPDVISALIAGQDLGAEDTAWAMDQIMSGTASNAQIAGFAVALRAKGETVAEISGLVRTMYEHANTIAVPGPTVDVVGTGGDRARTVNISTMSAIVVAGTGAKVVKHGNRAASSASGASDVLEKLGVNLDLTPARVAEVAEEAGITFCFAVKFHPAMRHVAQTRKELGVSTPFNFLGPLTNPAQPRATAVGVADARMAPLVAGVFATRGTSALVFRGDDGLDELAATGGATIWEVGQGEVTEHRLDAVQDLGLQRITVEDLRGADASFNAEIAREMFAGRHGAVRETVLLNAAAALVADGSLPGTGSGPLVARLGAGIEHAARSVDSGAATDVLRRWADAAAH